jgi:hypothetical protein
MAPLISAAFRRKRRRSRSSALLDISHTSGNAFPLQPERFAGRVPLEIPTVYGNGDEVTSLYAASAVHPTRKPRQANWRIDRNCGKA